MSDLTGRIVRVTVKFMSEGLTTLTSELAALNTQLKGTRTAVGKVNTALNGNSKASKKAAAGNNQYSKSLENVNKNQGETNKSVDRSRASFANFGKQLVNTAAFLIRFAIVMAVFKAVEVAIIGTAKAAANFQEALFDLQAIANTTNSELEKLSDTALDVAGSTRFTAGEIVGLQKALARLGFTTDQIIDSTESIARFAEATGEATEKVAEFVGKQLKAFQLSTIDVTKLVNAYTVAINNSALTLESLATSSQYASSISRSLGVSFKEQNALLATLTDNGLTASRAGTGLRKIFLELGAEGGSLIPILRELAETGITVAEAKELVGARAAGALLALVNQADAVEDLIDKQNSLSSVLVASARQNASFKAQVDAMSAAVNKLGIELGDWVTKTKIILNLIEKFGGGTTLRGFSMLRELGLEGESLDKAIEKVDKLKMLSSTQKEIIDEIQDPFKKRDAMAGASFTMLGALGIDPSGKTVGELYDMYEGLLALVGVIDDYSVKLERLENITTDGTLKADLFLKSIEGQEDQYGLIQTQIGKLSTKINEYRNQIRPLTEAEAAQVAILEVYRSLLQQKNLVLEESIDLNKEALKTFKSLSNMEEELSKAIIELDKVRQMSLETDIEKQKNLLIELDLYDDYLEYLERIRKELALAEQEEVMAEAAKGYVDSAKIISDALSERVAIGEITPEEAKKQFQELINQYINAVESLDPKTKSDIQAALNDVFFGFDPKAPKQSDPGKKGLELFGLNEEETGLLIDKAAELANSVNNAIFDSAKRRLEAERAAIDARYSYEEDRLNGFLSAGIISQQQYENQRLAIEKERVRKTNQIEKKRFEAEKANSLAELAIKTAIALIEARGIERIIVAALSASQAAIIASQRFQPVKFAKGGLVQGASHEQGGVPFTVKGRGGYEMEGNEFIVNKKSTAQFLPLLEQINAFGAGNTPVRAGMFANGGVVPQGGGRTDDLLEQLVSQSTQRTIAYISEEQLISRNNTRITNDIRKRL